MGPYAILRKRYAIANPKICKDKQKSIRNLIILKFQQVKNTKNTKIKPRKKASVPISNTIAKWKQFSVAIQSAFYF